MNALDAALLIVALTVSWSLYRAHRSAAYSFDLIDLLIENGRVSKLACVFMGSFVVTSWAFIKVAVDGKMTEAIFLAYGGVWVAPILAKLFSPQQVVASSSTTTSTTVTTPP